MEKIMQFNEQVKSPIPDITVATAKALIADLATSGDFLRLSVQHRIQIAAIERLLQKIKEGQEGISE